ncbi:RodZ domain-containing protein [Testudinibacter sp. TR-2022]|uniref:RodZ domain-containing protein n=1 Tax=Testudinibacter sp. TR-2022 TaxID=2585029 RepID=UPI001118764F|nr:RodZ domain-containing protein [Testudinibacter sp. TR-2022]TNH08268.1 DUF4115 domain-containing protein [Pasteurellaceae bacterium Phil11]TNH21854.1 DUF4115 domain-containing protein [Testudinibacter sp. TR-2022]TNH24205.1 DUF4115 domain-containing protein [Testudinibacter sp. TR-2022]
MENQQQQTTFNLGDTLRQAREKLGFSVEEAAEKTLLKTAVIKHIENNELIVPSCPPAFMKGYVRNYAKFLKVPESVWNNPSISFGEPIQNDLQKNMRNKHQVNHYASYSNWIGRLTWLIAVAMIGMTAYWWWQNYQQSQNERTSLVESFLSNSQDGTATTPSGSNSVQLDNPTMTAGNSPTETANNLDLSNTASNKAATSATENNVVLTPPADNMLADNVLPLNNENTSTTAQAQTSGQVLSNVMEQLDGTTSVASSDSNSTADSNANSESAVVPNSNGLVIEIVGNSCWLSVRDANRKVLAQKEYKQGEVLTFSDGEPYALVIGAPQNVRITFQGQEVPLTIDGRVARITLPN